MKVLSFLLKKEFKQIFRNPSILRLIMIMPMMQLILLPLAADYEVKNIWLHIADKDKSTYSKLLIDKLSSSNYFKIVGYSSHFDEGMDDIEKGTADIIIEIPEHFEKTLVKENQATIFIAANAINGSKASLGISYLSQIIRQLNQEIREKWVTIEKFSPIAQIQPATINWYNPKMNYKFFMVPGILVLLLTLIGVNLTSLNIVKEKEIGTIEQINVTPIKKYHFILAKLLPFWVIGIVVMSVGLVIAKVLYGIVPMQGFVGYVQIYIFASVYLLAVLGLGLLISTFAATQQQALLISFFFMMIFVLMGGLFTPIDSMPYWAKVITWFNPVTYFIEVMRLIVLKGSSLKDVSKNLFTMIAFALVLNSLAVYNFKKRS